MSDLFNLANNVALVTGASRGLGKVMATALAEAGAEAVNRVSTESQHVAPHEGEAHAFPTQVTCATNTRPSPARGESQFKLGTSLLATSRRFAG